MNRRPISLLKTFTFINDLVMLNIAIMIAYYTRQNSFNFLANERMVSLIILFNVSWIGVTLYTDAHEIYRIYSLERIFRSVVTTIILHALIFIAIVYINKTFYFSRKYLLGIYLTFATLVFATRMITLLLLKVLRQM